MLYSGLETRTVEWRGPNRMRKVWLLPTPFAFYYLRQTPVVASQVSNVKHASFSPPLKRAIQFDPRNKRRNLRYSHQWLVREEDCFLGIHKKTVA